jgi:hypothetical protein
MTVWEDIESQSYKVANLRSTGLEKSQILLDVDRTSQGISQYKYIVVCHKIYAQSYNLC